MTNNVLPLGLIIVDNYENIINANDITKTFLGTKEVIGLKLSMFNKVLLAYSIFSYELGSEKLYIMKNLDEPNFYQSIIEGSYDEIFVTDNKGIGVCQISCRI